MDAYMAEIRPFLGNYAPVNWQLCDGSLLPISNNQALFALLGTTFGGDGVSNFGVPNLKGRLPIGSGQGNGLTNRVYTSTGGEESVTLNTNMMQAHSHAFNVATAPASINSPVGNLFADPSPNAFYATTPKPGSLAQLLNADTVPVSGGNNQPHENMMPTMAVNYIICTNGIYPVKP